jgi:hypothetical protein
MGLLESSLENCDAFGTPITLNFNGEETIRTKTGSIVSIILGLIFLAYAIKRGQEYIQQDGPLVNQWEVANYFGVKEELNLTEIGFKIAFGVVDFKTWEVRDDPNFVRWIVKMREGHNFLLTGNKFLNFHKCTDAD